MVRRAVTVGVLALVMLVPMGAALADPITLGPCNDPDAIVVRVGQVAKVCLNP